MAIDYSKIHAPVQVSIEKHTSETQRVPRGRSDPTLDRGIQESTSLGRPIQSDHFIVEVRDRHRGSSGAVDIRHIDPHASAGLALAAEGDSGIHSDIMKRPVAKVAIEFVRLRVIGDE